MHVLTASHAERTPTDRKKAMHLEQFYLADLGHQSYLVADDIHGIAVVIDPRRDIDTYLQAATRRGVRITHILETHLHNDYVSGACELAAHTGAAIVINAASHVGYATYPVQEGDCLTMGDLLFTVVATPGHTPEHLSYLLSEHKIDHPIAIFTGGSLLSGGVGRTDLLGPELTLPLTHQQYRSIRRLLTEIPEHVVVYPTHGAGSFCGTQTLADWRSSTIGNERRGNPVLEAHSEEAFVQQQVQSYGEYPTYYAHMRRINQEGPRLVGILPALTSLTPVYVQQALEQGVPLIDGRPRAAFAAAHIPGTLNIESQSEEFSTYVGWLLPFNAPLMLLVPNADEGREVQVKLIRIGYEHVAGVVDGGIPAWIAAGLPVAQYTHISMLDFAQRLQQGESLAVVDVRREAEWRSGHIPDALPMHVGDLPQHLNALPRDRPIATVCRTGFRAAIAASMIAATGRTVIAVDGGMPDWIQHGLRVEKDPA
jgi:hydroxyacylglutathione hydrolase